MYHCPRTGLMVQGWIADEPMTGETYEPVTCTACDRVHLINPKTGKILESTKGKILTTLPATTRTSKCVSSLDGAVTLRE